MLHPSQRKAEVVKAIKWAWQAYVRCAWARDELRPMSCGASDWFNLGLTILDSIDTLILAGLQEEAERALAWVAADLRLEGDGTAYVNTFEATIRILGGLDAAAHLSGGARPYVLTAVEAALRLLAAFEGPHGLPLSDVNLGTLEAKPPHWTDSTSLSEATTLSLEFNYAAMIARRPDLAQPAMRVWGVVHDMPGQVAGLAPNLITASSLTFATSTISLGSRGDSYYEYMLKQWVAGGKRDALLRQMYLDAMQGLRSELLATTTHASEPGLEYVSELMSGKQFPKMDHLVCFLPGVLALGHLHGLNSARPGQPSDLALAQSLMHTCYQMYKRTATGLAPEIVHFDVPGVAPPEAQQQTGGGHFTVHPADGHNLLRPETMESLFVLWRVTRNETYQLWGWQMFRAFEMHSRLDSGGYTDLDSVLEVPAPRRDKMESFFLAETLKYALLLFEDPKVLPLDQYVFNTEAHPLPIVDSGPEVSHRAWYLSGDEVPRRLHGNFSRDALKEQIQEFRRVTAPRQVFPSHAPGTGHH